MEDARIILNAGADKISINSPALENPDLVSQLANEFGSQCVVVGIDSKEKDGIIMFISIQVIAKKSFQLHG